MLYQYTIAPTGLLNNADRNTQSPILKVWSFVPKRFLLLGAGLLAFPMLALLAVPRQERAVNLFVIERSKNRNVVHYDLVLDKSGFYDTGRPLDVYWLMMAEDGRREELSFLERQAYGFELLPNAKPTELGVRLVAVKDRPLMVRRRSDAYRAELAIRGVPAYLERIFVVTREGPVLPTVLYIELRGRSIQDGHALSERINK